MQNKKQLITPVVLLISVFYMGCSDKFQSTTSADQSSNDQFSNPNPTSPSDITEDSAWNKAVQQVSGSVAGGTYDGASVIEVDRINQSFNFIIPLPPLFINTSNAWEITDRLPGVKIDFRKPDLLTQEMVISIPVKYFTLGAGQLDLFGKLPNGDPIPFMPAGESRGFSINFPDNQKHRLHFYIVASSIGVFVETPEWSFPEELALLPTLGFPVKNSSGTQINGYLAIVPNKGSFASGIFLSSRIPKDVAYEMDQILRY